MTKPSGSTGREDPSAGTRVAPSTRARGARVEAAIVRTLEREGLRVLDRNVVAAGSELDVIAELVGASPRTIVFVEVRSRRGSARGDPLETIGPTKRRHLTRAATHWLVTHGLWERVAVRFDCVGVVIDAAALADDDEIPPGAITWIRDAFGVDG